MKNNKLRPCDCKDMETAALLNEQGIGVNDQSIRVEPSVVVLSMGHTTVRIPMKKFQLFAEWFLEAQDIKENINTKQSSDSSSK